MPASTITNTTTHSSISGMRPPFTPTYTPIITRSKAATSGSGSKPKNPKTATATSTSAKIGETCQKPLESATAKNSGVSDLMAKNSGIGRPPPNQTHLVGIGTKSVAATGTAATSIPNTMAQNPVADSPVLNTQGKHPFVFTANFPTFVASVPAMRSKNPGNFTKKKHLSVSILFNDIFRWDDV